MANGCLSTPNVLNGRSHRNRLGAGPALPYKLPRVSGFTFSALYRAANYASGVGGDWYDAFPLPDGRVGLSIGDVLGSGHLASLTMSKLRLAMQATAFVDADPQRMLEAANEALALHDDEPFATAVAGVLDPVRATLTLASAGHPLPMLRHRNGSLTEFRGTGPPLGIGRDWPEVQAARLQPGDMVVFYTDGLIEATRNVLDGERALRDALRAPHLMDSGNTAQLLHRRILGPAGAHDDVAIMTIVRRP